jgi:hypothetical protein
MKKYLLLALVLTTSLYLMAQEDERVIKASKPITKELTPQQIIDSLEKRFPNAQAVEYFKTPTDSVVNGWQISEQDGLEGSGVDYYTLKFKNDNITYYGLYKADGTLVMSKLDQAEVALPAPVTETLKKLAGDTYKDWLIYSSSYHKTINHKKNTSYYEITATKGTVTKTLQLAEDGTLIKAF